MVSDSGVEPELPAEELPAEVVELLKPVKPVKPVKPDLGFEVKIGWSDSVASS